MLVIKYMCRIATDELDAIVMFFTGLGRVTHLNVLKYTCPFPPNIGGAGLGERTAAYDYSWHFVISQKATAEAAATLRESTLWDMGIRTT
jgi:hypothetical protein